MKPRTIGLIIAVAFIIFAISLLQSEKANVPTQTIQQEKIIINEEKGEFPKSPELTGIVGYINTNEDISIQKLNNEGKIVLIDFWTYTCINCIRTLPFLKDWHDKYSDKGLVIIGVHTPEFNYEKEYENVKQAVDDFELKYPVVQDNDYATWNAFQNRFWPRKYLIDSNGLIRYDHIGEGAYKETELKIQELLNELGENVKGIDTVEDPITFGLSRTPELYAGTGFALPRGQNLGNDQGFVQGGTIEYTIPEDKNEILGDRIYVEGKWKNTADNLELVSTKGKILLKFTGSEVNIVADSISESPIMMDVLINGQKTQSIQIDDPKLYNIYKGVYGQFTLELQVKEKDFIFSAFTFG
jgi:thiol-disulfide isomerase/thioredoxin